MILKLLCVNNPFRKGIRRFYLHLYDMSLSTDVYHNNADAELTLVVKL